MSIREFTCLVGDIGVVSTRLHLFRVTKAREEVNMADAAYKSKEFNGLISILKIFLKLYSPQKSPEVACFSITGPVTGGKANIPLLVLFFNFFIAITIFCK